MSGSIPRARMPVVVTALCLAAVALWAVATADTTAAGPGSAWERKLTPDVSAALSDGRPVRVLVTFRDQGVSDRKAKLRRSARTRGPRARVARVAEARRLLAETAATAQAGVKSLLRARGVRYRPLWIANTLALTAPPQLIRVLARLPEVERIAADRTVRNVLAHRPAFGGLAGRGAEDVRSAAARSGATTQGDDDPPPEEPPSVPSHIPEVGADTVWQRDGKHGDGVVIGVLDTGAQWDHEALKEHYRGWDGTKAEHAGNWHDAVNDPGEASPDEPVDEDGHGTHVTGLAVGGTDSIHIGVAPGAKWIACRAFSGEEADISEVLECLQWFLAPTDENGTPRPELAPDIVNHSWGISEADAALEAAVKALEDAGIMQVFAAGNFGPFCSSVTFPAVLPYALAVGAMAEQSQTIISFFSGRGPDPLGFRAAGDPLPDVVAPGEFIWSAFNDGGYGQMIGTSQATPLVTGVAALMWSAQPRLVGDPARTRRIIEQTASPVVNDEKECDSPKTAPNNVFGWGRVNAAAAVEEALRLPEPAKPAPPPPPPAPAPPRPAPLELTGLVADGKCFRSVTLKSTSKRLKRTRNRRHRASKPLDFTLRYRLSADATVTFRLQRATSSRARRVCPGERTRRRPPGGPPGQYEELEEWTLTVPGRAGDNETVVGEAARRRERSRAMRVRKIGRRSARGKGRRGLNRVRLSQIVAGRRLSPGLYRITAVATRPGQTSAPARVKFWVLR